MEEPNQENWYTNQVKSIKETYARFFQIKALKVAKLFLKSAIDLLEKMLVFDPQRRISAAEALNHKYFTECKGSEDEIESDVSLFYNK